MSNLLSDPPSDSPTLDATQRQALVAAAQAKYGNEIVAPILQRIFPTLRYFLPRLPACDASDVIVFFPQPASQYIPCADPNSVGSGHHE
jgi:hypothetical protein